MSVTNGWVQRMDECNEYRSYLYSISRSERVVTLNAPRLYDTIVDFTIIRIRIRSGVDNPNKGASWSGYLLYTLKSNKISEGF
jgi:hypothetical protein